MIVIKFGFVEKVCLLLLETIKVERDVKVKEVIIILDVGSRLGVSSEALVGGHF